MNKLKLAFGIFMLFAGLLVSQTPRPLLAAGTNYYVDSVNGSDGSSGTSTNSPWKTLTKVQSRTYSPGDTINFKRGSNWTGELFIRNSGSQGSPITFRDYGTGTRPTISNPGTGPGTYVIMVQSSWVVVQGLLVKDSGDAGIFVQNGANHNIIQDIEETNTGFGVYIEGQSNLITNNYAHDLHVVNNTPTPTDDDYGAVGFVISNTDNEVSYNRCINCRAPSYDYGYDGGVVEIWANGNNSYIHHNFGSGSDGFIEVGGGSARNVRVAYNVSDNNYGDFACLHNSGTFASTFDNFRIENNTIVNTTASGRAVINCMDSPVDPSQLLFHNNVVSSIFTVFRWSTFTHSNNIYNMLGGAPVGFPLGSGERMTDPLLTTVNGCPYHLQSYSPAISAGMNLGYLVDYHGNPISSTPAIGAHEYVALPPSGSMLPVLFLPFISH